MNILFITSNRLGDAMLSTGILRALCDRYHDARLFIACGPHASPLFRAVPGLAQLHIMRKQSWNLHWLKLWQSCAMTRWDIVVDMRNSIVSRLLLAQRKAIGIRREAQHKVIENAQVLKALGWKDQKPPPAPMLWLDREAETEADALLRGRSALLALAPSANWPCKQWPAERFLKLAQRLTGLDGALAGAGVMIAAAPNEREQVEPILRQIPEFQRINLIGQPLLTIAACLKRANLFVGNDSGLMHMAATVGAPTLGLFGPGQEEIYGPYGPHCATVRTPESREELLARMPSPHARAPNLMESLQVTTVEAAGIQLLRQASLL